MTDTNIDYGPYIETQSGKQFRFHDPKVDDIDIADIAFALANTTRFNGHTQFYSVAEHSVAVAGLLPDHLRLAGLLHDAAEAYIGDIPSPLKAHMPDYKIMEEDIINVIFEKFGIKDLGVADMVAIKKADRQQLRTESFHLLPSKGEAPNWRWLADEYDPKAGYTPVGYPPSLAYQGFMNAFKELTQPTPKLVLVK